MHQHADVIVIGAGPVGLVSSLLLARQGHRIKLIERWSEPYPLPRAIGLSHESLRILNWSGATEHIDAAVEWDERYLSAQYVSGSGEALLQHAFRAVAESGWPEMQAFNQPEVEALLEQLVRSHPLIDMQRGLVVTDLIQDAEYAEVVVTAADPSGRPMSGAPSETLRAAYVVGCDGANSVVRQKLDIPMEDLGFAYDWLVVDIQPMVERDWQPFLGQVLGPPRPVTWAPSGPGRRRFEFMLLPGESREAMSTTESAWQLLAGCGVTADNAKLVRHAMYTFRARWVEQWRKGRALLAGDAAHLMPPFLGQGMNSGLRDAATLAWRLDLVLRGHVPADTLDDYSSERAAHVKDLIAQAVEIGRLICVTDPQDCEERDGMLRYLRDNPEAQPPQPVWRIGPGAVMPDDPQAAVLGRQGVVRVDAHRGKFDNVCGVGQFVMIARRGNPIDQLSESSCAIWKHLNGLAVQVSAVGPVFDTEQTYDTWFEDTGSEVILMRPDFYVFGTGQTIEAADALVQQLAAQLQVKLPALQ